MKGFWTLWTCQEASCSKVLLSCLVKCLLVPMDISQTSSLFPPPQSAPTPPWHEFITTILEMHCLFQVNSADAAGNMGRRCLDMALAGKRGKAKIIVFGRRVWKEGIGAGWCRRERRKWGSTNAQNIRGVYCTSLVLKQTQTVAEGGKGTKGSHYKARSARAQWQLCNYSYKVVSVKLKSDLFYSDPLECVVCFS